MINTLPLEANRWIVNEPEPIPVTAGVLAVFVHAMFAVMLLLNMNWQQSIQPHATVKLWESMPTTIRIAKDSQWRTSSGTTSPRRRRG